MDSSTDKCSKPSCKNTVPNDDCNIHGNKHKKCSSCRAKDSSNAAARRKRKREEATEPSPRAGPSVPQSRNLDRDQNQGSDEENLTHVSGVLG